MARKKRTVEPAPVVPDVPKLPALTQEELLRLRLSSAEQKLAVQEAHSAQLEREVLISQIDPQRRLAALEARMAGARARAAEFSREYTQTLERAGERLGINLKQGVTVNAETGEVTRHDKQE
jgi:hypothetical protein